jgi:O-antigen/teichoic acid export membrane protein
MSSLSLKKFFKGSFWVVLANVVTRFAGFVTLPLLARLLGPANLGLYSLVQNTVQTGDGLGRLGVDAAMHRNGSQYETIGTKAVGRLFGVGACLMIGAGGLIAICVWVARNALALNWLGEPRVEPWLGLTALIIVLTAISNPPWVYLVALHAFRSYSLRSSVLSIAGAILTLSLAWFFGFAGALWGLGLTALIQAIWGWWLTLPVLHEKEIRLRCDRFFSEARSILSFGLPFYASNFLSSFIALPLLGYVTRTGGIEQLGYLRVAQSLSQFITFLPTAIAPVVISSLSANLAADVQSYQRLKSLHLRTLWACILVFSICVCFSLDTLIPKLFGSTYVDAVLLSRITIWMAAITSMAGILSQYVISSGNTRLIAVIQTIGLLITILVALTLIPTYSSLGLLIAQISGAAFTLIAYTKPALKDIEQSEQGHLSFLAALSISLLGTTFLLPLYLKNHWLLLLVSIVIIILTLALLFFQSFTVQERALASSTFKQALTKLISGASKNST